jgi:hypothetical protein
MHATMRRLEDQRDKTVQVTVYMSFRLKGLLDPETRRRGMSISCLMRRAIEKDIAAERSKKRRP